MIRRSFPEKEQFPRIEKHTVPLLAFGSVFGRDVPGPMAFSGVLGLPAGRQSSSVCVCGSRICVLRHLFSPLSALMGLRG